MTDRSITHYGGCHCGAVRFEFDGPGVLHVLSCNCSICRRSRFEHVIVDHDRFRLQSGADMLESYRFNTGAANHLFCRRCGVKSFYQPRSHPEAYSVNLRCVDKDTVAGTTNEQFDGANWEAAIEQFNSPNS